MITAFDVQIDDTKKRQSFSRRFFTEALQQGLLLRPIGSTVYFMPPYCLSDDEADLLTSRTVDVLQKVLSA